MTAESDRLFDQLAPSYEEHFAVPRRRAYDLLAWERTLAVLPAAPATIVDVGCGTGRWARELVDRGYDLVGIEPADAMAARAARFVPEMVLHNDPAESAALADASVDAALAMGSLQYAADPGAAFANVARWLKPGGVFCVLVDSRIALGLELVRADNADEAWQRMDSSRARWSIGDGVSAALQLFDRSSLCAALHAAGFDVLDVQGLLVGASVWGREELSRRLDSSWQEQLDCERELATRAELADLGKQLFAVARRPVR